jgi:hypothetical protein
VTRARPALMGPPGFEPNSCRTRGSHRTDPAPRHPRCTHQRTEFHDRLIEGPRTLSVPGHQLLGCVPDPACQPFDCAGVEGALQHSSHIGVHRRCGTFEGEARDRTRGVRSHSGKSSQLDRIGWNDPVAFPYHLLRQPVQIGGPPVVSQPGPTLTDQGGRCRGQRMDRGISLQKAEVIRFHSGDLSLLEHELRHQDVIGIPSASPGEIPAMMAEPAQQEATEARGVSKRGCGHERK